MATDFPADKFKKYGTPFYYYDTDVLRKTVETASAEAARHGFHLHYAVKANANPDILRIISSYGIGADCVSWNEIQRALDCGFSPGKIVFAGAGKSDYEIENALKAGILCQNCESVQEIEVVNAIAGRLGVRADIALRINPYVDAHTHKHITTAIEESKFGIPMNQINEAVSVVKESANINITGIHFHIGSQITRMQVFKSLCARINEITDQFARLGVTLRIINVGGGLGIDYHNPEIIPAFREYFTLFKELLKIYPGQEVHFEPGRSLVAQCGSLISRVLYIKNGDTSTFAVIDAGMNDLIRPALYQAYHKIENITSEGSKAFYNVVGPVCESADIFGKQVELPETARGDIIAIRSVGAYGESMASRYNLRDLAPSYFSDRL